ncbi:hypothetical protein PMAYCL1PPCAC_01854, partial [Pristionchus mayeri]
LVQAIEMWAISEEPNKRHTALIIATGVPTGFPVPSSIFDLVDQFIQDCKSPDRSIAENGMLTILPLMEYVFRKIDFAREELKEKIVQLIPPLLPELVKVADHKITT